ncbi:MAG TPA: hypothetical protein VJ863_12320 [Sphaerochaeta sp.]|nr:hypothetical protein [Sphaerochaeta sp.]
MVTNGRAIFRADPLALSSLRAFVLNTSNMEKSFCFCGFSIVDAVDSEEMPQTKQPLTAGTSAMTEFFSFV